MASVLAIISKVAFGRLRTRDGGVPTVGTRIKLDRYESSYPTLDTLAVNGALYLVTVRPATMGSGEINCGAARRRRRWPRR